MQLEILAEPVNAAFIKKFAQEHFGALQQIQIYGLPATTILLSFAMRANARGDVKTFWIECRGRSPFTARLYSGVISATSRVTDKDVLQNIHREFSHEGVPAALRGLSAFTLPKELKNVIRFGCDVTDFDQVCAHPSIQLDRVEAAPEMYPATPMLRSYVADPKAFREAAGCDKRVLLQMTYGGALPPNSHPHVEAYWREQAAIREVDAAAFAAESALTENERTVQFYINQRDEQLRQRKLRTAIRFVGGKVASIEHDGVVAVKAAGLLREIQAELSFKVDVKPYPTNEEDLAAACVTRWSALQWGHDGQVPHAAALELARIRVEHLVEDGKLSCHESLGRYVALCYKETVAIASKGAVDFNIFDPKTCIWTECNRVKFEGMITDAFHQVRGYQCDGALTSDAAFDIETTTMLEPLENHSVKCNTMNECRQFVCKDLPPIDNVQGTLLFKCGTCIRFATGELFRPTSESRYNRHCRVEYKVLEAPAELKSRLIDIAAQLNTFWSTHDALEACGREVGQLGNAELRRALDEVRDSGHFPFLRSVYDLYKNWDRALYMIKWMCRIVAGVKKFNEALFIWGMGLSGKDTIVNFLTGLLGHETENGYVGHLKASYFNTSKNGSEGSEAPTAFLASLQDARLCVVSERKKSDGFDGDKLKPLTEQEGALIPARKLFKHPQAFGMTAAIVALSNHQLELGPDPDDGLIRRIRVDRMPLKFVPVEKITADSPSTWQPQDETIKVKAKNGDYCAEMVFVLQAFYASLFVRAGSNIMPVPVDVEVESHEVCAGEAETSLKGRVRTWLLTKTTPVTTPRDASKQIAFHAAIDAEMETRKGTRASVILEAGLSKRSDGRGHHYYEFVYPDVGKSGVQLKV